jgi:tetratricopeptide (TPR) repeat protein
MFAPLTPDYGKSANKGRKSQLAIRYSYSVRNAAPHTFVFWVHASTKARFKEAYRDIADRLDLPGRDKPKADILRLVSNWLCDETNGEWIIILDNADDIKVFYPKESRSKDDQFGGFSTSLTDYLPQSCNGSILITSRSKDTAARLAGGYQNIREVHTFDEEQAMRLLHNKLQNTPSDERASDLLRTLDYIPLAITQAAAYINRHAQRMTISDYLDEFHRSDKSKENLLNQDMGDLRRDKSASSSIVTAWQITFESVQKERRSAAEMLSLMSFFNPQGIPDFALRSHKPGSESKMPNMRQFFDALHHSKKRNKESIKDDFNVDISILQAYSLIDVTTDKGILKMHPLVQLCTRSWLSLSGKSENWRLKFLDLMAKQFPFKKLENWDECKQLVPHIEGFYQNKPTGKSWKRWVKILDDIGGFLFGQGMYNEAEKLYRRALEEKEAQLGLRNQGTLDDLHDLAVVLRYQGKYDEAKILSRRALELREKEQGLQHSDTLNSMNLLALVLLDQANYDEAEKLHRHALKCYEKALGLQHPRTLMTMCSLASVLRDQGKYPEAEKLNRQALEGSEKALGLQHPDTLASLNNLAWVLTVQGKYGEAEELNRRALEGYEKELGPQHPNTLMSVNNLAVVLQSRGEYDEAERLNKRALDGRERVLGAQHRDTLSSVINLAWVLQSQGKFNEAEMLNRQAVEGKLKQLGHHHPDTLMSIRHLAWVLQKQGKYDEAEKLDRRALEGLDKELGPQHPDTQHCVRSLVAVLRHQGKYDEAEELEQRAL